MCDKRAALLIGIDHYSWNDAALECCVNDMKAMSEILAHHENGDPNFRCETYESKAPEEDEALIHKSFVREAVARLFKTNVDSALFYFSGHGAQNELGSYIVTQDAAAWDPGVNFSEIIHLANQSDINEITIILDCCHSGAMADNKIHPLNQGTMIRQGVTLLCSSMGDELSVERNGHGMFTSILIEALKGGAADILGRITVADLYDFADPLLGAWDQRPVFKSHVSEMSSIRNCEPKISKGELRSLTDFFKEDAYAKHSLDPSYEPESKAPDPEKVAIFSILQKMTANGMVQPVDTKHMYHAAIYSKSCELTALGRFYWHLVDADRI